MGRSHDVGPLHIPSNSNKNSLKTWAMGHFPKHLGSRMLMWHDFPRPCWRISHIGLYIHTYIYIYIGRINFGARHREERFEMKPSFDRPDRPRAPTHLVEACGARTQPLAILGGADFMLLGRERTHVKIRAVGRSWISYNFYMYIYDVNVYIWCAGSPQSLWYRRIADMGHMWGNQLIM